MNPHEREEIEIKALLEALRKDPNDETTRGAVCGWLREQGEEDLATLYATGAREWLEDFCNYRDLRYSDLVSEYGWYATTDANYKWFTFQGNGASSAEADAKQDTSHTLFRMLSIVTGIPIPHEGDYGYEFSCSCG